MFDNPFATPTGENTRLHTYLFIKARVLKAADVGIFSLGVFTHDYHVDIARLLAAQRRRDAGIQDARSLANVLIETASDRQKKAAKGHMVLNVYMTDRAQVDDVRFRKNIQAVGRHHLPVLDIVLRTPRMFFKLP